MCLLFDQLCLSVVTIKHNWSEKVTLTTDWNTDNWSKKAPLYNWSKNIRLIEYQAHLIEKVTLTTDWKGHAYHWLKNRQLIEKGTLTTDWKTDNWSKKARLQLIEKETTDRKRHAYKWSKNEKATVACNWSKNRQLIEYQAQLIEKSPLQLIEKQTTNR